MCETCEFNAVNNFDSALSFVKKFLVIRILNLYKLYNMEKFEDFVKIYVLPSTNFQKVVLDFTTALTAILNYESGLNDADTFMEELERLEFQHLIFGLEEYFPESIKEWVKEQKAVYSMREENGMENYCNLLYCIDRFM